MAGAATGSSPAAPAAAVPVVPPKLLTLVIPHIGGRLLLGKKLRGFGEAGYYNGFGGKVEQGETIEASAKRELLEEAGITATCMQHCGLLTFVFDDNPQPWEVHVFRVTAFGGEPAASDEMAPRYFAEAEVPYERMWADDVHWYPLFLAGKLFEGTFHFHNTHTLVGHTLTEVHSLSLPAQPLQ
ncbi:hypothetical protein CHLNCDRAFT_24587 [Chlorella variabilis]|uniref:Oxidized purine nucleoside triphosphate hydrolase n=1 Tax=Chlorella variabilis TaxID=554065 RepID=E1ZI20_CHLVA|nr:hypothetical protein CHLNCDRAFT_24587 [Chlorella variabilis]EFN54560.1 hypothetical protein CHLNCDRAFT_24587 [Chlorella variabilis]|eukprot:XP_005846662.1 hypothetical protein CHLNCDRAFT_24587 [Chlorella variabilis]